MINSYFIIDQLYLLSNMGMTIMNVLGDVEKQETILSVKFVK